MNLLLLPLQAFPTIVPQHYRVKTTPKLLNLMHPPLDILILPTLHHTPFAISKFSLESDLYTEHLHQNRSPRCKM